VSDRPASTQPQRPLSGLREFGLLTIAALVIAIVLKTFVVQAFYIPSISMVPTLEVGDRILVNRLAYRFGDIERGDVIVFADPTPDATHDRGIVGGVVHFLAQGVGVVRPDDDDFIKRVIGLPGDVVEMRGGTVYVNGVPLDEPYVNQVDLSTADLPPTSVPDGMLFVMGDNRNHSGDSRYQPPAGLGFVPIDRVIGKAVVIIWPPSRIGGVG
jgi:signal peptidase I